MKSGEGRCGGNFLDRAGTLEIACNVLKGPDQPAMMRLCSDGSHGCIIAWNPVSGLTECAYFRFASGRRAGLLQVSPMHPVRFPMTVESLAERQERITVPGLEISLAAAAGRNPVAAWRWMN